MKFALITAAAILTASTVAAQDNNLRKVCLGDQCQDMPYIEAVKLRSLTLPPDVEKAFDKGYVSIETATKTTSGIVERGACGGFVINADERLVVTAQHCLPAYADQLNGKAMTVEGISVKYLTSLPEADIALVQMDKLPPGKQALSYKQAVVQEPVFGRSIQLSPLADTPQSKTVSDQSFFYGPVSFVGSVSSKGQIRVGRYSSANEERGASFDIVPTDLEALRVQGQAEPGFSGSPLYNLWGEVIGIVSGGNAAQGLVIVASARDFPKLLAKHEDKKTH